MNREDALRAAVKALYLGAGSSDFPTDPPYSKDENRVADAIMAAVEQVEKQDARVIVKLKGERDKALAEIARLERALTRAQNQRTTNEP